MDYLYITHRIRVQYFSQTDIKNVESTESVKLVYKPEQISFNVVGLSCLVSLLIKILHYLPKLPLI